MASAASEVGAGGGEAAAGGGVVLHGNTALHVAALTGNAAEVSRLLAEGAEIVENEFGKLPEDVASNDTIVSVLRGAALCVWQLDNCSECVSCSLTCCSGADC